MDEPFEEELIPAVAPVQLRRPMRPHGTKTEGGEREIGDEPEEPGGPRAARPGRSAGRAVFIEEGLCLLLPISSELRESVESGEVTAGPPRRRLSALLPRPDGRWSQVPCESQVPYAELAPVATTLE